VVVTSNKSFEYLFLTWLTVNVVFCECSSAAVTAECILNSIKYLKASIALTCIGCFTHIPVDLDSHHCMIISMESCKEIVQETLIYCYMCNDIYELFIETHEDTELMHRNFMKPYEDIVTIGEYVDRI